MDAWQALQNEYAALSETERFSIQPFYAEASVFLEHYRRAIEPVLSESRDRLLVGERLMMTLAVQQKQEQGAAVRQLMKKLQKRLELAIDYFSMVYLVSYWDYWMMQVVPESFRVDVQQAIFATRDGDRVQVDIVDKSTFEELEATLDLATLFRLLLQYQAKIEERLAAQTQATQQLYQRCLPKKYTWQWVQSWLRDIHPSHEERQILWRLLIEHHLEPTERQRLASHLEHRLCVKLVDWAQDLCWFDLKQWFLLERYARSCLDEEAWGVWRSQWLLVLEKCLLRQLQAGGRAYHEGCSEVATQFASFFDAFAQNSTEGALGNINLIAILRQCVLIDGLIDFNVLALWSVCGLERRAIDIVRSDHVVIMKTPAEEQLWSVFVRSPLAVVRHVDASTLMQRMVEHIEAFLQESCPGGHGEHLKHFLLLAPELENILADKVIAFLKGVLTEASTACHLFHAVERYGTLMLVYQVKTPLLSDKIEACLAWLHDAPHHWARLSSEPLSGRYRQVQCTLRLMDAICRQYSMPIPYPRQLPGRPLLQSGSVHQACWAWFDMPPQAIWGVGWFLDDVVSQLYHEMRAHRQRLHGLVQQWERLLTRTFEQILLASRTEWLALAGEFQHDCDVFWACWDEEVRFLSAVVHVGLSSFCYLRQDGRTITLGRWWQLEFSRCEGALMEDAHGVCQRCEALSVLSLAWLMTPDLRRRLSLELSSPTLSGDVGWLQELVECGILGGKYRRGQLDMPFLGVWPSSLYDELRLCLLLVETLESDFFSVAWEHPGHAIPSTQALEHADAIIMPLFEAYLYVLARSMVMVDGYSTQEEVEQGASVTSREISMRWRAVVDTKVRRCLSSDTLQAVWFPKLAVLREMAWTESRQYHDFVDEKMRRFFIWAKQALLQVITGEATEESLDLKTPFYYARLVTAKQWQDICSQWLLLLFQLLSEHAKAQQWDLFYRLGLSVIGVCDERIKDLDDVEDQWKQFERHGHAFEPTDAFVFKNCLEMALLCALLHRPAYRRHDRTWLMVILRLGEASKPTWVQRFSEHIHFFTVFAPETLKRVLRESLLAVVQAPQAGRSFEGLQLHFGLHRHFAITPSEEFKMAYFQHLAAQWSSKHPHDIQCAWDATLELEASDALGFWEGLSQNKNRGSIQQTLLKKIDDTKGLDVTPQQEKARLRLLQALQLGDGLPQESRLLETTRPWYQRWRAWGMVLVPQEAYDNAMHHKKRGTSYRGMLPC